MRHYKYILTLLFCGFFSLTSLCQTIDYYYLSISVYHTGYGEEKEWYSKTNNNIVHKASRLLYDTNEKLIEHDLKNEKLNESIINQLDSLFRLQDYKFTVDKSVIDSIKSRSYWKKNDGITKSDINNFFSHGDTVTLRAKDIQKDSLLLFVIDGSRYILDFEIKRKTQDTIKYNFYGNFDDGILSSNIQYWLSTYLVYRQHKIFSTIGLFDKYFDDKKLENILVRFIRWTKEK